MYKYRKYFLSQQSKNGNWSAKCAGVTDFKNRI